MSADTQNDKGKSTGSGPVIPFASLATLRENSLVDRPSIHPLHIFVLFILILIPLQSSAAEMPWGPWSESDDAPVLMMKADRRTAPADPASKPVPSVAATPFLWLLSFYQNAVGPVVSGRCNMHPTCSRYSVESIRKHGPVIGILMTADRMIHELDEQDLAPLIRVGNRYRYSDPVENNDFWWYSQ
jgi:hypothetical protein